MIQEKERIIQPYIDLLENFVNKKLNAGQFEKSFLEMFKNDSSDFSEREYEILNNIFYDVEDFCDDPSIRDEKDLDEYQLKEKSLENLKKLLAL